MNTSESWQQRRDAMKYALSMTGRPVFIATKEKQVRKHRKKRINKKWRKRYGLIEVDMMPDGKVMMIDGKLWMTKKTFQELKKALNLKEGR